MMRTSPSSTKYIQSAPSPWWKKGEPLIPVFSLLFEVADKSFKVADRTIQGRGGHIPGTECLNKAAEHVGREWSGGTGDSPILNGGLGVVPQENFSKCRMKRGILEAFACVCRKAKIYAF